ncbi:MAG: copper resistance protein CopC, partial [Chlorobi bacterium]|nr:copper resistance protein CopC [Chlorobiota bacterium]
PNVQILYSALTHLTLQISSPVVPTIAHIIITQADGKIVFNQEFSISERVTTISLPLGLASGTYNLWWQVGNVKKNYAILVFPR